MSQQDIVLAFSGGLDTSFCVPYLKEQGWNVHTVFADTGGVDEQERAFIENRAQELGVASHTTVDGGPAIWEGFVKPFVWAGEGYQGQYPLLVSDRYLIVGPRCSAPPSWARGRSRTAAPAWATTRCASTSR
jgi:argininosuccinate synthase